MEQPQGRGNTVSPRGDCDENVDPVPGVHAAEPTLKAGNDQSAIEHSEEIF